jgi:hypothetical protein
MKNAIAHNHGGTQQLEKTVTRGMTSLGMWNPCARTRDARPRPSGRRRRPRRLACIRRARFRRTHSGQVRRDAVLRSPVKYQSVAKGESKAEKKIVERQSSTPPRRRVGSKTSLPGSRAPLPLAHDAHSLPNRSLVPLCHSPQMSLLPARSSLESQLRLTLRVYHPSRDAYRALLPGPHHSRRRRIPPAQLQPHANFTSLKHALSIGRCVRGSISASCLRALPAARRLRQRLSCPRLPAYLLAAFLARHMVGWKTRGRSADDSIMVQTAPAARRSDRLARLPPLRGHPPPPPSLRMHVFIGVTANHETLVLRGGASTVARMVARMVAQARRRLVLRAVDEARH